MKDNFRQSMAWLHTWSGLYLGWLLFVIFLTGTICVFDDPITRWMQPEKQEVEAEQDEMLPLAQRLQALEHGQKFLQQTAPNSHFWSISLPSQQRQYVRVGWQDEDKNFQREKLDFNTGDKLKSEDVRETEGGHHFVHMHFELHAGDTGIWMVGFATIAMLVALVSGIVVHKKIFKDFFTFRRNKGQRSWLDAHNALGVLTLPFLFMIAYTGLVIFYSFYMPAGVLANFDNRQSYFAEVFKRPPHRDEQHIAAPVMPLGSLLEKAEQRLGRDVSFISVEHAGDISATAAASGKSNNEYNKNRLLFLVGGAVMFDAVTGQELDTQMPETWRGSEALKIQRVMNNLHRLFYADYAVKWLYFVSGLAGAAMMATGLILFTVKRRKRQENEFGAMTARGYLLIEKLNVAIVAGLMIACIGYFWVNRLIPVELAERAAWEIRAFFGIWALTAVYALWRNPAKAWIEQLLATALLCLSLPVLNWVTTGQHLGVYLAQQDWERALVEITAMGLGGLVAYAAYKLKYRKPAPAKHSSKRAILAETEVA